MACILSCWYSYRKVFTGFEFAIFTPISLALKRGAELNIFFKIVSYCRKICTRDISRTLLMFFHLSLFVVFQFEAKLRVVTFAPTTTATGNWGKIWSSGCKNKTMVRPQQKHCWSINGMLLHKMLVIPWRKGVDPMEQNISF